MKVKELIAVLECYHPDAEVFDIDGMSIVTMEGTETDNDCAD